MGGHIIQLQGVGKNGITVDVPYGNLKGEDNVYPWADVSKFSFLWIASFKRKEP